MKKVNLILIDGMRPDALAECGNPGVEGLLSTSAYTLRGRTVFPPLTLPCHMSLFHSVGPDRHGVTGNDYSPMVHPVKGIMEQLHGRRSTAMCFNWEPLRDLCRPGNCGFSFFISSHDYGLAPAARAVIEASEKLLQTLAPDFCFTYVGWPDDQGHATGWMSREYLEAVDGSLRLVERLIRGTERDYVTILTADHGGHDRDHGLPIDEDMAIPVILRGEGIAPRTLDAPVSILDIAPTILRLLDCEPAMEWEGHSLL
ncbi:MAG: alkaline phosphatase family protein [Clostridia bacterium]|nr:alkaline phosphatase family protein [Clostridia bacterium]